MLNCKQKIHTMRQTGIRTSYQSSCYSQRTDLLLVVMVQILFVLAGCSRDPVARKQKFIETGDRYFAQQKFPEALLTYGRALQLDPKSAAVHYRVAKCQ